MKDGVEQILQQKSGKNAVDKQEEQENVTMRVAEIA